MEYFYRIIRVPYKLNLLHFQGLSVQLLSNKCHSHRKGGNKEAIFYFGDRFCYVNESRALKLSSHSLTQIIILTRFFFVKAIHFSFFFFLFLGGWVGPPELQD